MAPSPLNARGALFPSPLLPFLGSAPQLCAACRRPAWGMGSKGPPAGHPQSRDARRCGHRRGRPLHARKGRPTPGPDGRPDRPRPPPGRRPPHPSRPCIMDMHRRVPASWTCRSLPVVRPDAAAHPTRRFLPRHKLAAHLHVHGGDVRGLQEAAVLWRRHPAPRVGGARPRPTAPSAGACAFIRTGHVHSTHSTWTTARRVSDCCGQAACCR